MQFLLFCFYGTCMRICVSFSKCFLVPYKYSFSQTDSQKNWNKFDKHFHRKIIIYLLVSSLQQPLITWHLPITGRKQNDEYGRDNKQGEKINKFCLKKNNPSVNRFVWHHRWPSTYRKTTVFILKYGISSVSCERLYCSIHFI